MRRDMKLVKISELFEVYYGVNLELNRMQQTNDVTGINFVSRTAKNNGVSAIVKKLEGLEPIPAGMLSVAGGGSVLETFLQPKPFYSGRDLYYLKPLIEMTDQEKLFYCMCIKANKYKYSYGRQANRTLRDILVPDTSEIPKEIKQVDLNRFDEASKPIIQKQMVLDVSKWKYFSIGDLFHVILGTPLHKNNMKALKIKFYDVKADGLIPYVTRTGTNNGIDVFVNKDEIVSNDLDSYIAKGKVLTIGAEGFKTFFQESDFLTGNKVNILQNDYLNKYNASFLSSILNKAIKNNFNYGRGLVKSRLEVVKIKLPVDEKGEPDWEFMENYIKSIPYSSSI